MNTIYAYGRFSSDKQEGNSSIERQLDATQQLTTKIKQDNRYKDYTVYSTIFFDEGVSSKDGYNLTLENGQWQRLMSIVKAGDIICIEDVDRLSRKGNADDVIEELVMQKGLIIDIGGEIFDRQKFEEIQWGLIVKSAMAKSYIKTLSTRTKKGKQIKKTEAIANKGQSYVCNSVPRYFIRVGKDYQLRPDAKEIILKAAELKILGYGDVRIAKVLNETYKLNKINGDNQMPFYDQWVYRVLRSKFLVGIHPQIDQLHDKPRYPQIMTPDYFLKLQNSLTKLLGKKRGKKLGGRASINNLFTGLLYCKNCGGRVSTKASNVLDRNAGFFYQCENARLGSCVKTPPHREVFNTKIFTQAISEITLPSNSACIPFNSSGSSTSLYDNYNDVSNKLEELSKTLEEQYSPTILKHILATEKLKNDLEEQIRSIKDTDIEQLNNYDLHIKDIYKNGDTEEAKIRHKKLMRDIIKRIDIDFIKQTATIYFKLLPDYEAKTLFLFNSGFNWNDKNYNVALPQCTLSEEKEKERLERGRAFMRRVKQDPERYERWKIKNRKAQQKYLNKKKLTT
jgi:DNA invertase Pin-like site-specific DNA recombinase